jgi:Short C-terminal domain
MKNILPLLCSLLPVLLFAGCKSLGVVQLSPDTYMASKTSAGGIWVSMASLKAEVITAANEFAESKGKIAIPLEYKEIPAAPMRNPSVEYQFRVVDKNDPEAKRTALIPRPDVVIQKNVNVREDIRTKDETERRPDLYTEIMKLDDLRKKGLISDAEFEAQKQKLLSNAK